MCIVPFMSCMGFVWLFQRRWIIRVNLSYFHFNVQITVGAHLQLKMGASTSSAPGFLLR